MCEESDTHSEQVAKGNGKKQEKIDFFFFIIVFAFLLYQIYIYVLGNPVKASSCQTPLGEPLGNIG